MASTCQESVDCWMDTVDDCDTVRGYREVWTLSQLTHLADNIVSGVGYEKVACNIKHEALWHAQTCV